MDKIFFKLKKKENEFAIIDINKIVPNSEQPRKHFDEKEIENLSQSIKENGLIQPIIVKKKNDFFEIIAGERRYRALKHCGIKKVSCIISCVEEKEVPYLALIENIQRKDLNFFEEALAYKNILESSKLTQDEFSKKIGKPQSTIANKIRLLKLDNNIKELILKNSLTERHARAILKLDKKQAENLIDEILKKSLNVSQTEKRVEDILYKKESRKKRNVLFVAKDARIFINSIEKAFYIMKNSGINALIKKDDNENYIEYNIKIPKNKCNQNNDKKKGII